MKSRVIVVTLLSLIVSAAVAGSVGEYLGYQIGRKIEYTRDLDLRVYISIPGQPGMEFDILTTLPADTLTVAKETLYQGNPGWMSRRAVYDNPSTGLEYWIAITDTAVEFGDTALMMPMAFEASYYMRRPRSMVQRMKAPDVELWLPMYMVPFEVGKRWPMGIAGTYPLEFGTLRIWGDTTEIVGVEDVTVPYGEVEDCHKIRRVFRQALLMRMQDVPVAETARVYMYEWYKAGMGVVKDSIHVDAVVWVDYIMKMRIASVMAIEVGKMVEYAAGVSEQAGPMPMPVKNAGFMPNPFRASTRILPAGRLPDSGGSELRIYNAAGRCIRTISAGEMAWDGRDDRGRTVPAGVYLIQAADRSYSVTRID